MVHACLPVFAKVTRLVFFRNRAALLDSAGKFDLQIRRLRLASGLAWDIFGRKRVWGEARMRTPTMIHYLLMAGLAALAVSLPVRAQVAGSDHLSTSGGRLDIMPIHHASLMLAYKGEHILVDPAPLDGVQGDAVTAPYKAMPRPDFILITHVHGDHFNVPILEAVTGPGTIIIAPQNVRDAMPPDLQARTKVMKNGDKGALGAVGVEAVAMYNTTPARLNFHPKGAGNGYVMTVGDKRVYIAGDTEETPELAHLANIDLAFIPVNLPYTEDVAAAAKWVKDFKPKMVFPYHYRNGDGTMSDMAAFSTAVGNASLVRLRKWY
jgi:L-ascorbate metabolism protein UlaG (beta-lactamase superfamily)